MLASWQKWVLTPQKDSCSITLLSQPKVSKSHCVILQEPFLYCVRTLSSCHSFCSTLVFKRITFFDVNFLRRLNLNLILQTERMSHIDYFGNKNSSCAIVFCSCSRQQQMYVSVGYSILFSEQEHPSVHTRAYLWANMLGRRIALHILNNFAEREA